MHSARQNFALALVAMFLAFVPAGRSEQAPVLVNSNITFRVLASNLSSGNNQRYETAGLNILKGLKPDVVAIQEFNVSNTFGINTTAAIRSMIDTTLGTNFVYFRESGSGVTIPNGVISRFPILTTGIWDDPQLSDRNFVWAKLDLPGTNDLYVISVHLHSTGGSSSRSTEATTLTNMIRTTFPANAFVVLAGDFNTDSRSEPAISKLTTILSDSPVPADASGDADTNAGRTKPYDYVMPSYSLASNRVATVIGSRSFANGLVFDSAVYTPLSEVSPVTSGDSHVFQMQHMAVVKDFKISYTATNFITVPSPTLILNSNNIVRWQGLSNVTYSVQASTNLPNFSTIGTVTSTSTNLSFTNQNDGAWQRFFRVVYP